MNMLTLRPVRLDEDLEPLVALINRCEAADRMDEGTSLVELRQEFSDPVLDVERDVRLIADDEGQPIGFAMLWSRPHGETVDAGLWFKVDPEHRGADVETELLRWAAARAAELRREHAKPAWLRGHARSDDMAMVAIFERHGFEIARYFLRMERPLDEPIATPSLPPGFTLRTIEGSAEEAAWVEAYNQSFIDHWNHHDMTVEQRSHWMADEDYRPDLDLVAISPEGHIAAFAWCGIHPRENERTGRNEGWIQLLGTRRGYRKLGLGRAMLLASLHVLKGAGVDAARLGVDAENPTGALRLYESTGFRTVQTMVNYRKILEE